MARVTVFTLGGAEIGPHEPFGADLNHPIISSLVIFQPLELLSALGSRHNAKRFIGLAIVVRRKDRSSRIKHRSSHIARMNIVRYVILLGTLLPLRCDGEAETTFKADLEKLLKNEGHMSEDKFWL
jgi:hypothetical protein